jgi:hypothetical protein
MHNRLDWNVRGYSHGIYARGQDSAGILCYEQSNDNISPTIPLLTRAMVFSFGLDKLQWIPAKAAATTTSFTATISRMRQPMG